MAPSLLEADDILTGEVKGFVLGPGGNVEVGDRAEGGLHTEESRLPACNINCALDNCAFATRFQNERSACSE